MCVPFSLVSRSVVAHAHSVVRTRSDETTLARFLRDGPLDSGCISCFDVRVAGFPLIHRNDTWQIIDDNHGWGMGYVGLTRERVNLAARNFRERAIYPWQKLILTSSPLVRLCRCGQCRGEIRSRDEIEQMGGRGRGGRGQGKTIFFCVRRARRSSFWWNRQRVWFRT